MAVGGSLLVVFCDAQGWALLVGEEIRIVNCMNDAVL